MLMRFTPQFEH